MSLCVCSRVQGNLRGKEIPERTARLSEQLSLCSATLKTSFRGKCDTLNFTFQTAEGTCRREVSAAEGLSMGELHVNFSTETYLGFSPSIFNVHLWVSFKYVARRQWVTGVWPVIRGAHGWLHGLSRIPTSGSLLGEGCFSPCLCPSPLLTHAHVHPLSISLSLSLRKQNFINK